MLFSFVVPIYNIEKYVNKCIESLIQQNFSDYEIILVDDGSTDRSGTICDVYQNNCPKIKVIHQNNQGLVKARKTGTLVASGEYIVPVDGDDWVDETLLERLNDILENKKYDLVIFDYYMALQNGKIIPKKNRFAYGEYDGKRIEKTIYPSMIRDEKGKYFQPNVWGKAFRRKTYVECQMMVDDRLRNGEDAALTYAVMTRIQKLYICDAKMYYYRIREDSMLHSKKTAYPWENCEYLHSCMMKIILQDKYNFCAQLDRYFSHALFNYAKSHLSMRNKYRITRKEILEQIGKEKNQYFIHHARFQFMTKDYFANFALRHNLVFLIWLYSRLEK